MPARGPLTIGIDARLVSGDRGGVEQVIIGLAGALSRFEDGDERYLFLVERGHTAWLEPFVFGPCALLESAAGTAPAAAPGGLGRRARGLARRAIPPGLRATIRRRLAPLDGVPDSDGSIERAGVEVMHFPMQVGFRTAVPTIFAPHDLQHLHLPEFFTPEEVAAREKRYRALCEQASIVTLMSSWGRDDIVARYGLAPEKIRVIPGAAATEVYDPPTPESLAAARERLALPPRFALYPAKAWPHKNHTRLVGALQILRGRGIDVPIVLTGAQDGRDRPVMARAEALGVGDLLHFVGFVTPAELNALYRLATTMVFPSLFEGWGMPVVEALAAGLPSAVSTATCLPAMTAGASLLFDPTDTNAMASAIATVWTDEGVRARLAGEGPARAACFSWTRSARMFRACYRLLGGRELSAEDRHLLEAPPLV